MSEVGSKDNGSTSADGSTSAESSSPDHPTYPIDPKTFRERPSYFPDAMRFCERVMHLRDASTKGFAAVEIVTLLHESWEAQQDSSTFSLVADALCSEGHDLIEEGNDTFDEGLAMHYTDRVGLSLMANGITHIDDGVALVDRADAMSGAVSELLRHASDSVDLCYTMYNMVEESCYSDQLTTLDLPTPSVKRTELVSHRMRILDSFRDELFPHFPVALRRAQLKGEYASLRLRAVLHGAHFASHGYGDGVNDAQGGEE